MPSYGQPSPFSVDSARSSSTSDDSKASGFVLNMRATPATLDSDAPSASRGSPQHLLSNREHPNPTRVASRGRSQTPTTMRGLSPAERTYSSNDLSSLSVLPFDNASTPQELRSPQEKINPSRRQQRASHREGGDAAAATPSYTPTPARPAVFPSRRLSGLPRFTPGDPRSAAARPSVSTTRRANAWGDAAVSSPTRAREGVPPSSGRRNAFVGNPDFSFQRIDMPPLIHSASSETTEDSSNCADLLDGTLELFTNEGVSATPGSAKESALRKPPWPSSQPALGSDVRDSTRHTRRMPSQQKNTKVSAQYGAGAQSLREDKDKKGGAAAAHEATPHEFSAVEVPHVSAHRSSWQAQLLATIEREFVELRRSWLAYLLEILIPLVCVSCTIILWAAFKEDTDEASGMFSINHGRYALASGRYRSSLCYNDTLNGQQNFIPGLFPCSILNQTVRTRCDDDSSSNSVPVAGMCYEATGAALAAYFDGLMGPLAAILPLDDIIAYQWLAAKLGEADGTNNALLISTGFATNNRYASVMASGRLFFVPRALVTRNLLNYFASQSNFFQYVYNGTFDSIDEARAAAAASTWGPTWAIVHIKQMDEAGLSIDIQLQSRALPSLDAVIDFAYPGGFTSDRAEMYVISGYATLERMFVDFYFQSNLSGVAGTYKNRFAPYIAAAPTEAYSIAKILRVANAILSFVVVLAFLYPTVQSTRQLVLAKERRIHEALLIMGLRQFTLRLAWFGKGAVTAFITSFCITILLKTTFVRRSDAFCIFLLVFLFALTAIPLAGLIASFFERSRMSVLLTPLIYFAIAVPYFAMQSSPPVAVTVLCLLSPTAFAVALRLLFDHEAGGGLSAANFGDPNDNPRINIIIVFYIADFVLYTLLMLYFDAVFPKSIGTARHPLFFILEPLRACRRRRDGGVPDTALGGPDGRDTNGVFEEEFIPDSAKAVHIQSLRRVFKRGKTPLVAVDDFCWDMPRTGISVLLGHNGAGKSTVINMMTGMLKPTSGDCLIFGVSIRARLSAARQEIGFCPQHNILWPELTCREHLEYFAKVKGIRGAALEDAVISTLREVDLLEKVNVPSSHLSGGQKRKLSVAMAFVGGSHLVFLDEPTAGMDVAARRHTWELLLNMSRTRSILLSTHFMDEADLLGDRVAIMNHGRLKCCGSSIFLKSRLGVGYSISMSITPSANTPQLLRTILSYVSEAEEINHSGCEISYRLPSSQVDGFPALLGALEENKTNLGVRGYSLSATTLEEVFLKVAAEPALPKVLEDSSSGSTTTHPPALSESSAVTEAAQTGEAIWSCEITGSEWVLFQLQFKAMFAKRFFSLRRDSRMLCFQIVCPVVCVLLAMFLNLVHAKGTTHLDFSFDSYPSVVEFETTGCEAYFNANAEGTARNISPKAVLDPLRMASITDFYYYEQDRYFHHELPRYGFLSCDEEALMGSPLFLTYPALLMYNSSSYHEVAIGLTNFYNLVLQSVRGAAARVQASVTHLPLTGSDTAYANGLTTILIGIIIMIPFTFLPSNPVSRIVQERECGSRHLQTICGLRFPVYWLTNFLFDFATYLVTLLLVIIIFLIFQRKEFVGRDTFGGTVVLFVDFGVCSIAAAYCIQFMFQQHSSAQTIVMAVGFITGFLLVIIVFIMNLITETRRASDMMRLAFRLIPTYAVGEGIINLSTLKQNQAQTPSLNTWSMSVLGWPCVYMAVEAPCFMIITLLLDHPYLRLRWHKRHYQVSAKPEVVSGEDSDVEEEREEVLRRVAEESGQVYNADAVSVVLLRKVYPGGKVAVRNVTFGVVPGEVFGFLGTNGAGKTTVLSILCQEVLPSSGYATVCGYDIIEESREAIQCIGYCPQFDATLDLLTVVEHLRVFAGIRGIAVHEQETVVQDLVQVAGLSDYASTLSCELSGGNRRKLSVALSLIGGPPVVFLDEPSAGMDPVARRELWSSIQSISKRCSVVLTTHHLEEIEALADCVAIMVNGALRCIGDKTHLKNKYGSGFEVNLRIASARHHMAVTSFMAQHFPEATLNECRNRRFTYALPPSTKLSSVFAVLQLHKRELGITDYSVSQTSIEQVFMRISEEASEAKELNERLARRRRRTGKKQQQ